MLERLVMEAIYSLTRLIERYGNKKRDFIYGVY